MAVARRPSGTQRRQSRALGIVELPVVAAAPEKRHSDQVARLAGVGVVASPPAERAATRRDARGLSTIGHLEPSAAFAQTRSGAVRLVQLVPNGIRNLQVASSAAICNSRNRRQATVGPES